MSRIALRTIVAMCAFAIGVVAGSAGRIFQQSALHEAPAMHNAVAVPDLPSKITVTNNESVASEPEWNPPESPPHTAHVLEVGEYHGDEVTARTGERWLGLYLSKTGSSLIDSVLKITAVRDQIVDDDKSHAITGKLVSVNQRPDPIMLVRGASTLRPGRINTLFVGRMRLTDTVDFGLTLGGADYGLRVLTKDTTYGSAGTRDGVKLVLQKDEVSEQVLYELPWRDADGEAHWNLLWAGDMDGDNKLDLYVQVSYHYNMTQRKLFLSSQAKKGKLVREVAELAVVGC